MVKLTSHDQNATEVDIWQRVISPGNDSWNTAVAKSVLEFKFPDQDIQRMNELAHKAQAGNLSSAENNEAQTYDRIGLLIELMHSKARLSLRNSHG